MHYIYDSFIWIDTIYTEHRAEMLIIGTIAIIFVAMIIDAFTQNAFEKRPIIERGSGPKFIFTTCPHHSDVQLVSENNIMGDIAEVSGFAAGFSVFGSIPIVGTSIAKEVARHTKDIFTDKDAVTWYKCPQCDYKSTEGIKIIHPQNPKVTVYGRPPFTYYIGNILFKMTIALLTINLLLSIKYCVA